MHSMLHSSRVEERDVITCQVSCDKIYIVYYILRRGVRIIAKIWWTIDLEREVKAGQIKRYMYIGYSQGG